MSNLRTVSLGLLALLTLAGGQALAADLSHPALGVDLRGKTPLEAKAIIDEAAVKVCRAEYSGLDYRADPIDRIAFGECVKSTTQTSVNSYLAKLRAVSKTEAAEAASLLDSSGA